MLWSNEHPVVFHIWNDEAKVRFDLYKQILQLVMQEAYEYESGDSFNSSEYPYHFECDIIVGKNKYMLEIHLSGREINTSSSIETYRLYDIAKTSGEYPLLYMSRVVSSNDINNYYRGNRHNDHPDLMTKEMYVVHDNMQNNSQSEYVQLTVMLNLKQLGMMSFDNVEWFDD